MITERQITNFWNKVDRRGEDECWPWTASCSRNGYGHFGIGNKKDGTKRIVRSSRLAFYFAHENQWPENQACHTCDNRLCCNPLHIYDGTQQENIADRNAAERQAKGEDNGRSKLTEDQVLEIRRRYVPRVVTLQTLGDEFGVSKQVISFIIRRNIWKHIISYE